MLKLKHPVQAALLGLILIGLAPPARAQLDSDRLETYIERTGEILDRAKEFVSDAPNPRAIRILEQANQEHQRSIEFLQRDEPKQAFAHSKRARDGAQQAARISRELSGDSERLQRRLERYMDLRERVTDRVNESGDERALRFLHESEQQARRARDLQQQGDVELALQVLKGAEDLLGRAARIAFEGTGSARLEREIERTRSFIERVGTENTDDPAAMDLLTSAREALHRAEDAATRGQVMVALNSLDLARRLASRAAATGEHLDANAVERQLERFDERFARVSEQVQAADSQPGLQMLERARVHRDRAARLLADGKFEPALRQLKAGFDLLSAAQELGG